jgi:hypothetical protein
MPGVAENCSEKDTGATVWRSDEQWVQGFEGIHDSTSQHSPFHYTTENETSNDGYITGTQ